MKKTITLVLVLLMSSGLAWAQKYAYVDTEYILDNIPEYKDAQNQLNELSMEFQEEIEGEYAEIQKMYANLQAEAVLIPDDIREKRKSEIREAEDAVKALQNKRFGVGGEASSV